MHGDGLADDEAIGDELADGLARVGVGDLVDFVRVQPDLALAAVGHGGREALLGTEVDPTHGGLINIRRGGKRLITVCRRRGGGERV